jgi:hypothetical protein
MSENVQAPTGAQASALEVSMNHMHTLLCNCNALFIHKPSCCCLPGRLSSSSAPTRFSPLPSHPSASSHPHTSPVRWGTPTGRPAPPARRHWAAPCGDAQRARVPAAAGGGAPVPGQHRAQPQRPAPGPAAPGGASSSSSSSSRRRRPTRWCSADIPRHQHTAGAGNRSHWPHQPSSCWAPRCRSGRPLGLPSRPWLQRSSCPPPAAPTVAWGRRGAAGCGTQQWRGPCRHPAAHQQRARGGLATRDATHHRGWPGLDDSTWAAAAGSQ